MWGLSTVMGLTADKHFDTNERLSQLPELRSCVKVEVVACASK